MLLGQLSNECIQVLLAIPEVWQFVTIKRFCKVDESTVCGEVEDEKVPVTVKSFAPGCADAFSIIHQK